MTSSRGPLDCWSDFAGCVELRHTGKLFLSPTRQKLEDWPSRNSWEIQSSLVPVKEIEQGISNTHSSRTVRNHTDESQLKGSWLTFKGFQNWSLILGVDG